MQSYTKKVESLVHELILYTTDEESMDSEISRECDRYIRSNLKFHRFLSVNSHEVQRRVEGLQMKLFVHNKISRSDLIIKLFSAFIELPFRENSALSDVHYSCVSFLTLCANRPTAAEFKPQLHWKVEEDNDEEVRYWTENILESRKCNGFLDDQSVHSSNSDLSNWSGEDEDSDSPEKRRQSYIDFESQNFQALSNVFIDEPDDHLEEDRHAIGLETFKKPETMKQWREFDFGPTDYFRSYWKYTEAGKTNSEIQQPRENDSRREDNFFSCCQSAIQLANPFAASPSKFGVCLTETVIIRECIWALLENNANVIIFQNYSINGELSVNREVFVSHLSNKALRDALNEVLYLKNVLKPGRILCYELSSSIQCATINSFIEATRLEIFKPFDDYLLHLELDAMNESKTFTLLRFIQKLNQWKKLLQTLSSICSQILLQLSKVSKNEWKLCTISLFILQKCSFLLSSTLIVDCLPQNLTFSSIMNIFLASWRPYLKIIETWVSLGKLLDPFGEFVAVRNADVAVDSSHFWTNACFLSQQGTNFLDEEELLFIRQIMDIGKAVEMYTVSNKCLPADFPPSLWDIFSQYLLNYFEIKQNTAQQEKHENCISFSASLEEQCPKTRELESSGGSRPYLCIGKTVEEAKRLALAAIIARLDLANSLLLKEVKSREMDFYCWQICALYLFQSSACEMHEFLFELFEDVAHRRKWQDATMLTLKLQHVFEECASEDHFGSMNFGENVVVGVKTLEEAGTVSCVKKNRINQLNVLTIGLHMPWPVNVVFSSTILESLNKVFLFLTQLKWAKYAVTRLKLSDFADIDDSFCNQGRVDRNQHRVSSLVFRFRFRLIHFVNVLESYFMTRVIHSASDNLNAKISKAHTIRDVLSCIDEFAETLKSRCLLGPECSKVRSAVMTALNTSLAFVSQCEKAKAEHFDEAFVSAVSQSYTAFDNVYLFLRSLLRNLMKRGSFQHLEFLAVALA